MVDWGLIIHPYIDLILIRMYLTCTLVKYIVKISKNIPFHSNFVLLVCRLASFLCVGIPDNCKQC